MDWRDSTVERLAACTAWTYLPGGPPATEPTALAALALVGHGKSGDARRATDWLAAAQSGDGSLGVLADHEEPRWPTSLAVLAWSASDDAALPPNADKSTPYRPSIRRAVNWILAETGTTPPRRPYVGHDTTIPAWPWVRGTHSWLEPTAFHCLALKAAGHGEHPRCREGIRMLADRLLPGGGCNYGNTTVLGQTLLPQPHPTALALWALAGESIDDRRIRRSLDYLRRALGPRTAVASLCYGIIALSAYDQRPPAADRYLAAVAERTLSARPSPHKLALIALACLRKPWPGPWKPSAAGR